MGAPRGGPSSADEGPGRGGPGGPSGRPGSPAEVLLMGKGALVLHAILQRVDDWLYNAGLAVAVAIVLFGVMLCLSARPRPAGRPRRASPLFEFEEGALRDD